MELDAIDRRRFIRAKFPFTVHIYPSQQPPLSVYTEDISEAGIRVTANIPLDLSSLHDLVIYVRRQPITCKGKVIWVKQRVSKFVEEEPFFDIGIQFEEISQSDRLIVAEKTAALARGELPSKDTLPEPQ